jgi:hypothetical protein
MKAYCSFLVYPKFKVNIQSDRSKHPSKKPNSVLAESDSVYKKNETTIKTIIPFVDHTYKKLHPVGRETAKQTDATTSLINVWCLALCRK